MKIHSYVVAALAAVIILPVAFSAQEGKEGKGKGKNPFMAADKDADGKISSAEFVAFATASGKMTEDEAKKKFADLDTDKDGSLSREEFRAGLKDMGMGGGGKKKAESEENK